jgi:hypothetical protein
MAKVFQVDTDNWVIDFGNGASIQVQGTGPAQVRKLGEWSVYLDRRELQLIVP